MKNDDEKVHDLREALLGERDLTAQARRLARSPEKPMSLEECRAVAERAVARGDFHMPEPDGEAKAPKGKASLHPFGRMP